MPNYSSRDMAINDDSDLAKSLQTPNTESTFKVGDYQLKAIRLLANIFNAETKIPKNYTLPTPPFPLTKKSSKLPRVEDQTSLPPRVDPNE